jgi:hypothetical protein
VLLQDGMVYHHEVLEHGDFSQRQQVVRWLRRFPFSFLSDREYTIARREFIEDGDIYACTKVRRACRVQVWWHGCCSIRLALSFMFSQLSCPHRNLLCGRNVVAAHAQQGCTHIPCC